MKTTIKKGYIYILAIILMATIGTIYAFSNAKAKDSEAETLYKIDEPELAWYQYQLNSFLKAEVQSESNYEKVASEPECNATANICAIQLEDTGLNPSFSSTQKDELWDVQQHSSPTPSNIKMQQ